MPHLTIQATPNVSITDEKALLKTLNKALWESGHFGKPRDIKARILPVDSFLVGVEDEEQEYGFIYAHLKLMTGRDIVARNQLAQLLVTTIEEVLAKEQSKQPDPSEQSDPSEQPEQIAVQICAEVEEISAVYQKKMLGS